VIEEQIMTNFGTILKRGRRRYKIKESGEWGRCESCDERHVLHPYDDDRGEIWKLCDKCSNGFVKEETE